MAGIHERHQDRASRAWRAPCRSPRPWSWWLPPSCAVPSERGANAAAPTSRRCTTRLTGIAGCRPASARSPYLRRAELERDPAASSLRATAAWPAAITPTCSSWRQAPARTPIVLPIGKKAVRVLRAPRRRPVSPRSMREAADVSIGDCYAHCQKLVADGYLDEDVSTQRSFWLHRISSRCSRRRRLTLDAAAPARSHRRSRQTAQRVRSV